MLFNDLHFYSLQKSLQRYDYVIIQDVLMFFISCFSAAVEIFCPSGTYALGQNTTCTKCLAGKKCPAPDGSGIDDCQPGQYSLPGATTFHPVFTLANSLKILEMYGIFFVKT